MKRTQIRLYTLMLNAIVACLSLTSCDENNSDFVLSDEASTPYEADIRFIHFDDTSILKQKKDSVFTVYTSNPEVRVSVDADLSCIAPRFDITRGARIYAVDDNLHILGNANGFARDFSQGPLTYMVESANKLSHRLYTLSFNCNEVSTKYHFEWSALNDSVKNPKYYTFDERDKDGNILFSWCTANGGFGIAKSKADPMNYPTYPCDGHEPGTKAVAMTTRSTGSIAAMVGMRLAAGNIFLGDFNLSTAFGNPRASTHFGVPFTQKPVILRGWMNYTPGDDFQDEDGNIIEYADSCDIYAILYRNTDLSGNDYYIDGNTVVSNDNVVARAKLQGRQQAGTNGEWEFFEIAFNYEGFPEPFDAEILASSGYNLALVASSSTQGAFFRGALGSTLKVDEIEIVCEK